MGDTQRLRLVRASAVIGPALLLVGLLSGCGVGGDTLTAPTYSPDTAAQQAINEYDANKDGLLDAKELERCPSLKQALDSIDRNGDKRLSAEEIAARIQSYQDSQVGLMATGCHVSMDGKPLSGATVTYVPEKFMGSSIRPASGTSDEHGAVALVVAGERLPGVQPGLYRVEISKKDAGGQEMIPARYNQNTSLGIEVTPRKKSRGAGGGVIGDGGNFKLISKAK